MFYNHFQLLSTLISVLSSNCFPTGSATYLPTIFFDSNHHPAPPLHSGHWIWDPPLSCPATSSKFAYPVPLGIFITGCVIVQLWFYNMLLKGSGILWSSWSFRNSKTIMPQTPADCALRDSFQREPDPPPAWSRKSRQRPLVGKYHRILAHHKLIHLCQLQCLRVVLYKGVFQSAATISLLPR